MENQTFNAGIDYYNLESGTSNAVKVTASAENRTKRSTSGANTFGDAAVVDSNGETAAPTAEYQVVNALSHTLAAPKITLGALIAAESSQITVGGGGVPVCVGRLRVSTRSGSAPTITMGGQALYAGATALRTYLPPAFSLTPRHRAQDFLSLCTIKKGSGTLTVADAGVDYGLESVDAEFPIEFTLGQPKGELKSYDIHGGMVTVDFVMNWYAGGEPTIVPVGTVTLCTSSAASNNTTAVNTTMSSPVAKACPENGYTQYTWQVSFPLIGYEAE